MYELGCIVRVDELGFFIYWKSDSKVRATASLFLLLLLFVASQCVSCQVAWKHQKHCHWNF